MMKTYLSVYILAGGQSARMGQEKGLVKILGKTMIEYVLDVAKSLTDRIVIVTANPAYEPFGYELIQDQISFSGPAGGIDAMLQHSSSPKNLVLSCDMPLIDAQSIRVLIDESKSFDITAAAGDGGVQPFPAVYHAQCKEQWRSLLSEGYKKLQDYFQHFAVNQVDPQKLLRYNTLLFKNVNTPIDITETEEFIFKRSSQP